MGLEDLLTKTPPGQTQDVPFAFVIVGIFVVVIALYYTVTFLQRGEELHAPTAKVRLFAISVLIVLPYRRN